MCDVFVCGCLSKAEDLTAFSSPSRAACACFCSWSAIYIPPSVTRASCVMLRTHVCVRRDGGVDSARLPLKRSDPEALRQPSHLLSPASDTSRPRCFFPTTPFPPPPARPVVLRRCQTSSLLHCASGVGTAVRKIGFAFACVSASHTGENSELESGPVDLRVWKNIAGGIYCFCLTHNRTARV